MNLMIEIRLIFISELPCDCRTTGFETMEGFGGYIA